MPAAARTARRPYLGEHRPRRPRALLAGGEDRVL